MNCPLFPTLQRSPTPPRRPCFTRHGRCGPGSGIAESCVPCEPAAAGLLALAPGEGECSRARRRHWTVRLPAPGGVAGSPSLGRACATPTPRLAPAGQPSCEPRPPGPGTGNEGPGRPRARTAHRCLCAQLPWPVPLVQGLVACHSSSAWPVTPQHPSPQDLPAQLWGLALLALVGNTPPLSTKRCDWGLMW